MSFFKYWRGHRTRYYEKITALTIAKDIKLIDLFCQESNLNNSKQLCEISVQTAH